MPTPEALVTATATIRPAAPAANVLPTIAPKPDAALVTVTAPIDPVSSKLPKPSSMAVVAPNEDPVIAAPPSIVTIRAVTGPIPAPVNVESLIPTESAFWRPALIASIATNEPTSLPSLSAVNVEPVIAAPPRLVARILPKPPIAVNVAATIPRASAAVVGRRERHGAGPQR
jgi:hypothetical protein